MVVCMEVVLYISELNHKAIMVSGERITCELNKEYINQFVSDWNFSTFSLFFIIF